jgi:hypothetical protein
VDTLVGSSEIQGHILRVYPSSSTFNIDTIASLRQHEAKHSREESCYIWAALKRRRPHANMKSLGHMHLTIARRWVSRELVYDM